MLPSDRLPEAPHIREGQGHTIGTQQIQRGDILHKPVKCASIHIRVTLDVKDALERQAEREHRSATEQMEHLIMQEEERHKADNAGNIER